MIATHNPGKLAEMRELLAPYGIEAVSAGELGLSEPDETGTTFQANARIKAIAAAQIAKLPAFADDSGLAVDALNGQPGIYSARWAGENKDFHGAMARIERLLQEHGATAPEQRKAQEVAQKAMQDEEVRKIVQDPKVQQLLAQMQMGRPFELEQAMKSDPDLVRKLRKLSEAGLINMEWKP